MIASLILRGKRRGVRASLWERPCPTMRYGGFEVKARALVHAVFQFSALRKGGLFTR